MIPREYCGILESLKNDDYLLVIIQTGTSLDAKSIFPAEQFFRGEFLVRQQQCIFDTLILNPYVMIKNLHRLPTLRLFIVVFSMLLFITGCKKDGDAGNGSSYYYMRFKINGTQVEYKAQIEGNFNKTSSSQFNSSVAGLKELFTSAKNNMSLLLATAEATQTGVTYTNYTTSAAGMQKAKLANLVYIDGSGKNYLSWMEEFATAIPTGTEVKALIKITDANNSVVKGVFSGVLYSEDFSEKLTITDGEFYGRVVN